MNKLSFEDVEMDLNSKSETFDYEVVLKQLADTMRLLSYFQEKYPALYERAEIDTRNKDSGNGE